MVSPSTPTATGPVKTVSSFDFSASPMTNDCRRGTSGVAVVAYLDGHVENVAFQDNVPDPGYCSGAFVTARRANRLGFASPNNEVYTAE